MNRALILLTVLFTLPLSEIPAHAKSDSWKTGVVMGSICFERAGLLTPEQSGESVYRIFAKHGLQVGPAEFDELLNRAEQRLSEKPASFCDETIRRFRR